MIAPTFIDRLISRISPRAGYNRMRYRALNSAVFGSPVSRKGAATGGSSTVGNWLVRRLSRIEEARERETLTDRAEDLLANEPLAATASETMGVNIVGSGLIPQAELDAEALGISEDAADKVGEQMDQAFELWSQNAGLVPGMSFADHQFHTILQMMGAGEFVSLGRMLKKPGPERHFSFCLQPVAPLRLKTPPGLENDFNLHDGVELDTDGSPRAYHLAEPADWRKGLRGLSASDFKRLPRVKGHRIQVLHGFRMTQTDQYRGVSPLAAGMKGFRDLSDYLDHELVAAMVASTITILLETQTPTPGKNGPVLNLPQGDAGPRVQDLVPGSVWTAPNGWKPTVPEIKRPNANFPTFLNTWVTILSSMLGMPREIVFKDFTDTTFSSARAALNEAWRTFLMWRSWLVNHYCAPIWLLVQEEAYLRGMIDLPKGAPGFYKAMHLWCAADWQGPGRGTIDPEKEQAGYEKALENFNTTYTDNAREQGRRFKRLIKRRKKEAALLGELATSPDSPIEQEAA
jgi:lambda family phage portal protein